IAKRPSEVFIHYHRLKVIRIFNHNKTPQKLDFDSNFWGALHSFGYFYFGNRIGRVMREPIQSTVRKKLARFKNQPIMQ
ncbi:hypothetical protein ACFFF5_10110, partial [Lederbergia wuyishanensis]